MYKRLIFVTALFVVTVCSCTTGRKTQINQDGPPTAIFNEEIDQIDIEHLSRSQLRVLNAERLAKENQEKKKGPQGKGKGNRSKRKSEKIRILQAEALIEQRPSKGRKTPIVTLVGNARVRVGDHFLSAPRIQIEDSQQANLTQGFRISNRKSGVQLAGRTGYIDTSKGVVTMRRRVIVTDTKGRFRISAKRATRFLRIRKTLLVGNLKLQSGNAILRGKTMIQEDDQGLVTIYGDPTLKKGKLQIRSNLVQYEVKSSRLAFIGEVRLRYGEYEAEAGEIMLSLRRSNEFYMKDDIRFEDGKRTVFAKELFFQRGKKIRLVANRGVQMTDKEYNMNIQAQQMIWDENRKQLDLRGEATLELTDSARSEKDQLVIRGDSIQRNVLEKEIVAREAISVRYQEKVFLGHMLDYNEKKDVMIIQGNPSISEAGLQIEATKIILFPNREQLSFSHDVKVQVTGSQGN